MLTHFMLNKPGDSELVEGGAGTATKQNANPVVGEVSGNVTNAVEAVTVFVDPELVVGELAYLKAASLDEISQNAERDIGAIDPVFLETQGIDLTNLEGRLKAKYGERWDAQAHSLKVWVPHLVSYLKDKSGNRRDNQRDIARAVSRIKEILG